MFEFVSMRSYVFVALVSASLTTDEPVQAEWRLSDITRFFLQQYPNTTTTDVVDEMIPYLIESGVVPRTRRSLISSVARNRRILRRAEGLETVSSAIRRLFKEGGVSLAASELIPKVRALLPPGDTSDDKTITSMISRFRRTFFVNPSPRGSAGVYFDAGRLAMQILREGDNESKSNVVLAKELSERLMDGGEGEPRSIRVLADTVSKARMILVRETGNN
jgi:hypothetical protein